MNAVISGQAGVAVLVDGLKLASIHAGSDGEAIGRRPEEIRFLLNDARDLEFVKSIGQAEAARRLEIATSKYDALHIALILLDGELTDDTRQTAAEELEELLGGDPEVADFPARVLFSHSFPHGADPEGALAYCTAQTPLAKGLIERLIALQPVIVEVCQAWERIPLEVFGAEGDRARALAAAVKAGLFRDFVLILASQATVDTFWMQALLNQSFEVDRNRREILREWTAPLRDRARVSPTYVAFEDDQSGVVENDSDHLWQSRDLKAILDSVERQKAAIVKEMRRRNFGRTQNFVDTLIDFQLRSGDPVYACKSLCDLAMKAKEMGLSNLQLELMSRAIEVKDDDGWSWAQYGEALRQTGQLGKALEAYDRALRYVSDPVARVGRAEVLKAQNRLGEALAAYESVIADFPENVFARAGRAEILKAQNRLEESLLAYESMIADFPEDGFARKGRAEVLKAQNRLGESLLEYESVIEDFPGDAVARNGRAEVLKAQSRLGEALSAYESVIADFPENAVARNGRADVLKAQNRLGAALSAYESAIMNFPENAVARRGRADVLKTQNRLGEALAAYESVIADFPGDSVARRGRAEVLKAQNRLDEALSAYEAVITDFPEDIVARTGSAGVLAALERWDEALARLPASTESPVTGDWVGYHIRGMILLRMGRTDEATEIFRVGMSDCPRPAQREYFRTSLALAQIRQRAFAEAGTILEEIETPNLIPSATVLRFHAFGELGRRREASESSERLRPFEQLPEIRDIADELRSRYLEKQPAPRHDDEWLIQKEVKILLAAA